MYRKTLEQFDNKVQVIIVDQITIYYLKRKGFPQNKEDEHSTMLDQSCGMCFHHVRVEENIDSFKKQISENNSIPGH